MLLKGSPAILLELEAGYRGDMAQLANKCRVRSQKPCIQVRTVCQPECTVLDLKLFFIFLLDLSSAINRAKYPPLSYTLPIHLHHPGTVEQLGS